MDLPDQPKEASRAERARDASAARRQKREIPDPDERGRAYEATRVHASADATEQGSYWDKVPRFGRMWAEHERRWPERQPAAEPEGSADPVGTYRSRGGFKLDPERHAETIGAIGRMRETEPPISADMQAVEKENTCGGWLAGFDRRIKGDDRLKEKVAEQAAAEPDKGINTRWITQQGQRFEVQFHTPESSHAKEILTHKAYERIRDTTTSRLELRELHAFQRELSAWIQVPDGAADIPDFKKEGF